MGTCYSAAVTDLEYILAGLVSRLGGCRVAVVATMDGLLVERYPAASEGNDVLRGVGAAELEHVTADMTSALTLLAEQISEQLGSRVDELIALGEYGGYLARRIGDDLFCFVLANASADLGTMRSEVEGVCRELTTVFA